MTPKQASLGREAVQQAAAYLRSCGIRLPRLWITTEVPDGQLVGGSFVDGQSDTLRLNIGVYPTSFHRNWFAMHELGHILWALHRPQLWKRFRQEFGQPRPPEPEYNRIHKLWSAATAASGKLSRLSGPHRPKGEPSHYGAKGGGEERFCELLAFMYACGDFSKEPPSDLADLFNACWHHGLARMT